MSWLDEHLETFVRPYLGSIPNIDMTSNYLKSWDQRLNMTLKAVWERAKIRAMGRPILLPGRDVWEFEILARMEGFPTTFRPEFSGEVVRNIKIKEDFSQHYVLDSGFAGSVPKALKATHFGLVAKGPTQLFRKSTDGKILPLMPTDQTQKLLHQVFPHARMFRPHETNRPPETEQEQPLVMRLASALERNPKYWWSATVDYIAGKPSQVLANEEHFKYAAILTQFIVRALYGTQ